MYTNTLQVEVMTIILGCIFRHTEILTHYNDEIH